MARNTDQEEKKAWNKKGRKPKIMANPPEGLKVFLDLPFGKMKCS